LELSTSEVRRSRPASAPGSVPAARTVHSVQPSRLPARAAAQEGRATRGGGRARSAGRAGGAQCGDAPVGVALHARPLAERHADVQPALEIVCDAEVRPICDARRELEQRIAWHAPRPRQPCCPHLHRQGSSRARHACFALSQGGYGSVRQASRAVRRHAAQWGRASAGHARSL